MSIAHIRLFSCDGVVTIQQGMPGDAVPWPGAAGVPAPSFFSSAPQAGQEGYLNSYYGVTLYYRERVHMSIEPGARKKQQKTTGHLRRKMPCSYQTYYNIGRIERII